LHPAFLATFDHNVCDLASRRKTAYFRSFTSAKLLTVRDRRHQPQKFPQPSLRAIKRNADRRPKQDALSTISELVIAQLTRHRSVNIKQATENKENKVAKFQLISRTMSYERGDNFWRRFIQELLSQTGGLAYGTENKTTTSTPVHGENRDAD